MMNELSTAQRLILSGLLCGILFGGSRSFHAILHIRGH